MSSCFIVLDVRRDQREYALADEPVMYHEIGAFEPPRGAQREQVGITGTGADEPELAGRRESLFHAG
jgi:hypothetical protein